MPNEVIHVVLSGTPSGNVHLATPEVPDGIDFAAGADDATVKSALAGLGFETADVTVTGSSSGGSGTAKVIRFTLTGATGNGTLTVLAGSVTASLGESAASLQSALRARGGAWADVVVSADVPTTSGGTGKVIRLTATAVTGPATLGGSETVTPGDLAAAVQSSVQDLGGDFAAATVTDASDPGVPGLGYVLITTGGTPITDGSQLGHTEDNAFDGNTATFWIGNAAPDYIGYDRGAGNNIIATRYSFNESTWGHEGDDTPTAWTFEGSDDGADWTTLDTQSDVTPPGAGALYGPYSFSNTHAYRYYRLHITANTNPGSAPPSISELNIYSNSGAASGHYDIHLPVASGDAAAPSLSGTGWAFSVQTPYAAPTASGTFDVTFTVADGNVTAPGLSGAGWAQAVHTAYVAPSYNGTYIFTFGGEWADRELPSITSNTTGVTVVVVTPGGDTSLYPNPLTATGSRATHDAGAASTSGLTARHRILYSGDPTATFTLILKHSTTGAFGGEETVLHTFAGISVEGVQEYISAPGVAVHRYVKAYHTISGGSSPSFVSLPTYSRSIGTA